MPCESAISLLGGSMNCKPKPVRLWQEIILTLSFKAILLTIIWAVWFSAPQDQTIDGQQVAAHIFSQQSPKEQNHDAVTRAR